MNRYRAVLFDCDGTVSDSRPGIFNSIYYALEKCGINTEPRCDIGYFLGPPLYHSFKYVFGVDDEMSTVLTDTYREYYSVKGLYETTPYEGIAECLKTLKAEGIKTAVVSSKPSDFLKLVIPHIGLDECFDIVVGPEMDNHVASKERLVCAALKKLGMTAGRDIAMVGDRHFDIDAAAAAGITAIGVTYGYGTEKELREAGANVLCASPAELQAALLCDSEQS